MTRYGPQKLTAIFLFLSATGFSQIPSPQIPDWFNEQEKTTALLYARISPAVVNISNIQYRNRELMWDYERVEVPAGVGSGFLWDQSGHIITNFHVVQGTERGKGKLSVSFSDGTSVAATLVGAEPRKDIAVLKVKLPSNVKANPIQRADSRKLLVGQSVIAIGSPFGLEQSLSRGVVSALNRSIPGVGGPTIREVIQTDAAVNPGNSGGPLLDSRGFLIGMNTAIYSQSGSSAGIGFAVPSNTIKRIANQIIKFGRVKQPGLGVRILSDDVADRVGVQGVIVLEVPKGTGAARAGMLGTKRDRRGNIIWGDIVVGIGAESVKNYDDMYNVLEKYNIGDEVEVTILRNRKKKKIKVRLSEV